MNAKTQSTSVVIEWSPGAVSAYDSGSNNVIRGASIAEIAPKLSSKEVVMAVGRRACFVRSVNVPDAPKADLLQALTLSIGQYVPIGSGDACVDIRLIGDLGPDGRPATLVAMRATDLRTLQEEAKHAGIRIIATVPSAYGSWLLANGTSLPDCAAVSESAEGMGVDLISGGELRYSRALPPNSSNGQLAPELARTFSAAGIKTSPTFAVGMSVPSAQYKIEKSPLEALAGTGWTVPGVEFELPEVVTARSKAGHSARARITAVVCIAALALAAYVYVDRASDQAKVDKVQATMNRTITAMQSKQSSYETQANDELGMVKVLSRGFHPAQTLGDVVALVSNDLPKGAWLTNVSISRGQTVTLRGTALTGADVKAYLDSLNKEDRLRDVRLVFANNALIESTPVVQFSATAFPVGNLPLVDRQGPKAVKR